MSAPARVLVCFAGGEADRRAAASVAAGFARDDIAAEQPADAAAVVASARADDLVILSTGFGAAEETIASMRLKLGDAEFEDNPRPPIIGLGDAERREAMLAAGATLFLGRPAFVKDVVTLGRVVSMPRESFEPGWGGELDGLHLYYIVRALGAARHSGVLALFRGGRRGELRFFEGEVTSAQVGALHGQAAFHQLLLWPDASFDLRIESVVRRQQIPLTPVEVLQDAERFLRDFHDLSGGISPAAVFEQDPVKAAEHGEHIPKEAREVLRLFDGERTVADVIEESPLRLTETLKVLGRLVALGIVGRLAAPRPADAMAALSVEDWLVGQSGPPPGDDRPRRRGRGDTPARGALAADWGSLAVGAVGKAGSSAWEAASYAPVVPSQAVKGEISVAEGATVAQTAQTTQAAQTASVPTPAPTIHQEGAKTNVASTGHKTGKQTGGTKRVGTSSGAALAVATVTAPAEAAPRADARRKKTGELRSVPKVDPHFADHEQAFFDEEHAMADSHAAAPTETFADLDEGHKPRSFWQRIFGRRKRAPSESHAPVKPRR